MAVLNAAGQVIERVQYTPYGLAYHHPPADISGDRLVGSDDQVAVILNWGSYGVGDVNRDGMLDVVTANSDNTANVFLGNGSGGFAAATSLAVGTTPRDIVLSDLNRDGKLDIATVNSGASTISVARGNGDGTFVAATATAVCNGAQGLAAGDVTKLLHRAGPVRAESDASTPVLSGGQ